MRAHVPRGAVTAMEAPGFESPPATGKLAGHFGASTPESRGGMETPCEACVRTRWRGRVRYAERTSFSRSGQRKPLTLQSREGLTGSCRLGLHVNRKLLLRAGRGWLF